jgi:GAF domain-containing protein
MRRPGKAVKTQRRKTLRPRNAPKAARHRKPSVVDATKRIVQLEHRLNEALAQQTATADVLKVVSSSTFDLQTVLDTLVQSATRLCEADMASVTRPRDVDGAYYHVARVGFPPEWFEYMQTHPLRPERGTLVGRALLERRVIHIPDVLADQEYTAAKAQQLGQFRAILGVPLLRGETTLGVFFIARRTPQPFTDKQIELVTTFAAQAVIAIENTRLLSELRESLQQQTATADVLKVISSSPGELKPVFNAMLENAVRICDAKFGNLLLRDGDGFLVGATHGAHPAFVEYLRSERVFSQNTGLNHLLSKKEHYHLLDLAAVRIPGDKLREATINLAGARTLIGVPMLKDDKVIGAIIIYRQEVRPFTEKQIELVKNFAAQAVIAIENTRLLSELRESLQQQTATSEVLKVISSSPGELEPVFKAMLENATRICEAKYGIMLLHENGTFRTGALCGVPPALAEERQRNPGGLRPPPKTGVGIVVRTKRTAQIADILAEPEYFDVPAGFTKPVIVQYHGARTELAVPMLKEGELVGVVVIYRTEVRPFTDKQIELVTNFAAQAVIAIENARLLNELRESLQQQTATADVLKVISKSPGELKPVFEAMLESAVRICGAKFGNLWLCEGSAFRVNAMHGAPPGYADFLRMNPVIHNVIPGTALGRIASERHAIQIPDAENEKAYAKGTPLYAGTIELARARTIIAVPLLKDEELVGAIVIFRQEVRSFTDKQIELLTNFASQAVIAIENTRLLSELRESLQQQTATADVLKVIAGSSGDLAPVFKAMLENAVHICEAKFGHMFLKEGEAFRAVALESGALPYPGWLTQGSKLELRENPEGPLARIAATGTIIHIGDLTAERPYLERNPRMVALVENSGARTFLGVPMFKGETLVGTIGIYRQQVRPFTDKQIELVNNFASQAVIAIENARLINELRQRTHELAASLEDLRTTQDRLVQTQKLALLGQLTAGIAHEIKNPLNFVNNFSGISAELIGELQESLKGISLDDKTRIEINELADTLKSNFDKVVHHGRRADAIVKNMLQHSREGSGEHRVIDINALVEESLNLAWHGARAETQGFEIKLKQSLDPSAGEVDIFPQDIRRALLNMISNGFYAATKRRAETNGGGYEPTLTASTKSLGDRVEISIRDNGTGMPPDVKEKMFNPFFTTKPTGEGTGLGLSISHDIIVKQHGGSIEVDTQPGEFTEIRVILPRAAVFV